MRLQLSRFEAVGKATIGLLYVSGKFFCFTLEDKVQEPKVPGETAIPAGTYQIEVGWSDRFQRNMPRLQNVPEFSGILIHWGNSDVDTEGCILVGHSHEIGRDWIGTSKPVFDRLYDILSKTLEDIEIEIVNNF